MTLALVLVQIRRVLSITVCKESGGKRGEDHDNFMFWVHYLYEHLLCAEETHNLCLHVLAHHLRRTAIATPYNNRRGRPRRIVPTEKGVW